MGKFVSLIYTSAPLVSNRHFVSLHLSIHPCTYPLIYLFTYLIRHLISCVPHITYISKIPTQSTYLLAQTTYLHAYIRVAIQANSNLFTQSVSYNYKLTYL
jgi:hypothetical protein